MGLSGKQQPSFRTLIRFRGETLKAVIEEIFIKCVKLLGKYGYVKLENYFVDGTKIESASNRYMAVWKANTERYERMVDEKLKKYLKEIKEAEEAENGEYGERDLEEMGGEKKLNREEIGEIATEFRKKLEGLQSKKETGAKEQSSGQTERVKKSPAGTKRDTTGAVAESGKVRGTEGDTREQGQLF